MQPGLVSIVVIGAVAGWLAGMALKGRSLGLAGNMAAGVAGAFVGSRLFYVLGISIDSVFGMLVVQFIGAVLVLFLVGLARRLMSGNADSAD
jgi:uncharacterized membrane protein YeaQ/YmgE (transglycosylase-associated protein family)